MAQRRRIDIHTLIQRDRDLRLSKMHVLVEAADADHAVKWVQYAMAQAYPGEPSLRHSGVRTILPAP